MADRQALCIVRGSINIDDYFRVSHIVRPGETLSSSAQESCIGGKGANQAVAIARAGGAVRFYGAVGKDGMWVKERMENEGVDASEILVTDVPTGRAIIQVDDNGENSIILFPGANHNQHHEDNFRKQEDRPFPFGTHLLLQNEITLSSTIYALRAVSPEATVILNPSPLPSPAEIREFPWDRVNWLIVNASEARELYQAILPREARPEVELETAELLTRLGTTEQFQRTNLICTLGAKGVLAYLPPLGQRQVNDQISWVPSIYVAAARLLGDVRDTTGAGDCFTGYFVQGLMGLGPDAKVEHGIKEEDVEKILRTCVVAAGICVEKSGTIDSIPTRKQVDERIALFTCDQP